MGKRLCDYLDAPPLATWPRAIADNLPPTAAQRFHNQCKAIELYFTGAPLAEISSVTGIARNYLPGLARKALTLADDGQILGFRAFLPFIRTRPNARVAPERPKWPEQQGGHAGLLQALFKEYPGFEEELLAQIRQSRKRREPTTPLRGSDVHRLFLGLLKQHCHQKNRWPYTTKHLGRRTIHKYAKLIWDTHFSESVMRRESKEARAHLAVGSGHPSILQFFEPYDAVETDAYRIDCHTVVAFHSPDGAETDQVIDRLWIIAAVEVVSTAVLAFLVVYRSEVTSDDVVRLIRLAGATKWAPREFEIPELSYGPNAGYPSGLLPSSEGAAWSLTLFDGALAHLAKHVHDRARKMFGFSINWGPVAHFERRPNVEHTFNRIATEVFHRLPSTTGSNPHKGRADNAQEKAVRFRIRANHAEELAEVYFAQHNATPTSGQFSRSPLETLAYFLEGDHAASDARKLPERNQKGAQVMGLRVRATVRGNRKQGRRPYVQLDGVEYTNPVLADAGQLIGVVLTVDIDEDDYRQVMAYLPNGAELGYLTARGKWGATKHSRRTRKIIRSLINRRILVLSEFDDPVLMYYKYLATPQRPAKASRKKGMLLQPKTATEAVRVAKEIGIDPAIAPPASRSPNRTTSELASRRSLVGEVPFDFSTVKNKL